MNTAPSKSERSSLGLRFWLHMYVHQSEHQIVAIGDDIWKANFDFFVQHGRLVVVRHRSVCFCAEDWSFGVVVDVSEWSCGGRVDSRRGHLQQLNLHSQVAEQDGQD